MISSSFFTSSTFFLSVCNLLEEITGIGDGPLTSGLILL